MVEPMVQEHLDWVVDLLKSVRFNFANEAELQDGIEKLIMPFHGSFLMRREVRFGARDRIDFMVGAIGIEVKVGGSAAAALRQMSRYAKHEEIRALVLVTDRVQAGVQPTEIHGKPIRVVCLMGGLR